MSKKKKQRVGDFVRIVDIDMFTVNNVDRRQPDVFDLNKKCLIVKTDKLNKRDSLHTCLTDDGRLLDLMSFEVSRL